MSELLSTLIRELGASTGTMILFMGLAISLLYQRQARHGQRFNGLMMMLRDADGGRFAATAPHVAAKLEAAQQRNGQPRPADPQG